MARDQNSRSWGRKAKCASALGPQGTDFTGYGCLVSLGVAGCWWEVLRGPTSPLLSQESQRRQPPLLQPLMLTARVRQAGLQIPGSKKERGWGDWATRQGSRGGPLSAVPRVQAPQLSIKMDCGGGAGAECCSPGLRSLTLPRPSVSKLLQYLGHQDTHEPSEVLPAGLR